MKRCPGTATNQCCLVIEGDGEMAELDADGDGDGDGGGDASTTAAPNTDSAEKIGAEAAAMQVTVDIPSTLTTVDGHDEYRLRWNQLSAHASFSRVVPDTGSMRLQNPWLFWNTLSYPDDAQDLTNIWRFTTTDGASYNNPAVVLPVNTYAYQAAPDNPKARQCTTPLQYEEPTEEPSVAKVLLPAEPGRP